MAVSADLGRKRSLLRLSQKGSGVSLVLSLPHTASVLMLEHREETLGCQLFSFSSPFSRECLVPKQIFAHLKSTLSIVNQDTNSSY